MQTYVFRFNSVLFALLTVSGMCLTGGSASAEEGDFQVLSISINAEGELEFEYPSADGSYYLLMRGESIDILDLPVDARLGSEGSGNLRDTGFANLSRAFYVIQKISASDPLDSDNDGIDDVFELQHPDFLSPVNPADAPLDFDMDTISNLNEYLAGTDPSKPPFTAAKIEDITPNNGEEMVNVSRNAVVYFDAEMDPDSIDENSFYLLYNQIKIKGLVEVSSTGRFATFFPADPLPSSTQLQVIVDGDLISDMEGNPLDADGNGADGGMSRTTFRTLAETRIAGTNVWGYVKDSFTEEPIEGVTIYVNAFPNASASTDSEGRFELVDMPAPEFFVHIVGGTAANTPDGFTYPNIGKPFRSIRGQSVQISMEGEPFDIFLPPMALDDAQTLSNSEVTEVGFGSEGKDTLTDLFPEIDPSMWDVVCIDIAPGSVRDDIGNTFTQAAIIPVPPDRIPEPLPEELGMPLVISIQTFGGTRFDVPAPVTFPNLPDPITGLTLAPGEKSGLWSFNHDAGRWELQGSMTVSEDGMFLVSDPGVGIRAPGWHGANAGNQGEGGGGGDGDCGAEQAKLLSSSAQCIIGTGLNLLELTPGIGCAVSLGAAAAGAALDCNIDPESCSTTMGKAALSGALGCVPGAGLVVGGLTCLDSFTGSLGDLNNCQNPSALSFPLNQSDMLFQTLDDQPVDMVMDDQFELITRTRNLFEAVAGDPIWWEVPTEQLAILNDLFVDIEESMLSTSPGGVEITAAESDTLLAAVRPSNLSDDHINTLIARFNRFSSGGITEQEQNTIAEAATSLQEMAEMLEASGWETTHEGFTRGLAELSSQGDKRISHVKRSQLYYRLTDMETGFERRNRLNSQGQFTNLILAANTFYLVEYVDPETLEIGTAVFESMEAGNNIDIPAAFMAASIAKDTDMDGLPDDIEEVVGTLVNNPDSDGDGIKDGAEIQQGFNPLEGISMTIGVMSNVQLPDWSKGVDADSTHAYVTAGESGLAVFDVSDPFLPILEDRVDLTGFCSKVTISESANVAAIRADPDDFFRDPRSLHFVDISDPTQLEHIKTVEIAVQHILHDEGIFYVSVGFPNALRILLFEASTLNQIGGIATGGTVRGMDLYKDKLYVAANNFLEIYDMADPVFPLISSTRLPGRYATVGGSQLHAEDDILYIGTNEGYETMDISDPANPLVLSEPDDTNAGIARLASNGSGLLLALSGNSLSTGVDLFETDDPSDVNQRLTTLFTDGRPLDIKLKDGLALIADDFNGFTIFNYLDLDRNETPPVVTLDLESLDVDPGTEGIQVVEGSRIFIEPDIFDDVQVRRSEWLLDGQVMDFSQEGHKVFTAYLPLIADGSASIDIQARASDTGGNIGTSNVVTLELVPGLLAPELFLSAPGAGGAGYNVDSLVLWFKEAIAPDSIDISKFVLDLQEGGNNLTTRQITMTNPRMFVLWLEEPLAVDEYQLTIDPAALATINGSTFEEPMEIPFVGYNLDPTTAVWISDADGNFSDPANWIFGLLPALDQDVYIHRPTADPVVSFDYGMTVGNMTIFEPFMVERGLGFFSVRNTWNSTQEGTLVSGTLQLLDNAVFSGPVTFDGGGIQLSMTVEFQSDFTMVNGSIILDQEESDLQITGTVSPGDVSIECRSGAVLEVPWLTTMGDVAKPNLKLEAQGVGSILTLPNLETLTPPIPGGLFGTNRMNILARNGGTINLPSLTTINVGRIKIDVNGTDSVINMPGISSLTGPDEGTRSVIEVTRSGLLNAGPITTLDYTELELDETVQFPITALTSLTNGLLQIDGFTPDLSNLVTIENIGLRALFGGVIEFADITSLTQDGSEFYSDRENSLIRFPNLQQISGSQIQNRQTKFRALRQGRIELPALTTLDGYFNIRTSDEETVIDLSALTQLTSIENRLSLFNSTTGSTIQLSNPTLTGGDLQTSTTGFISGNTITNATGSLLRGPGTLNASLTNQAEIRLDKDTGPVVIDGNLILDTESLVVASIGLGTDKTGTGHIQVTGAATLGGTLEIKEHFSYTPTVGDEFEIMTFETKTMNFQEVTGLSLKNDLMGELEITDQSIKVKVVAP